MKRPPAESRFPYNKACIVLAMCLALMAWAAYLNGCIEVMGGFMFAELILWQVVNGLILKRHFWHIPEEKTTFWALVIALLLCGLMLYLCLSSGNASAV